MNKQRREELLKVKTVLESLGTALERIKDDEEFAYDNMPENLQYSMRGEESQDAINSLDEAIDNLNESISCIEEVI